MPKLRPDIFNWSHVQYLALGGLTVACYSALYPPVELTYLAWIALVPWLTCVMTCPPRKLAVISYLAGLAFFLINLNWILPITVPGYITMAIYLAFYWVLAGWTIHRLVRHYHCPLLIAVPIVWIGCEFLRGYLITGFPWFYLGHSQVRHLTMIQIADLVGAYGVSFVIAMVNGLLADVITQIHSSRLQRRRTIVSVTATVLVLIGTVIYGRFRLRQDTMYWGPRLAVVQEDFPLTVEGNPPPPGKSFIAHMKLSMQAASKRPAMIIWPETSILESINPEFTSAESTDDRTRRRQAFGKDLFDLLTRHAREAKAYLIVGAISKHINPPGHYPTVDKYNSAIIFDPEGKLAGRYDKIHLVLFGEFVPFRYTFPALYRFLNENMTPYGRGGFEYSLTHGTQLKRFQLKTQNGTYRYAVAICYEDAMAYLIRKFTKPRAVATNQSSREKQIDFLINISNDGWFNHSSELPQHLYICAFRAVENRVGIARAVNTGISAFIDPTGRIEEVVRAPDRLYGPSIRGYLVRNIKLDKRISIYTRFGDWFAISCLIISLAAAVDIKSLTQRLYGRVRRLKEPQGRQAIDSGVDRRMPGDRH